MSAAPSAPTAPPTLAKNVLFDYYVILDFEATCDDTRRLPSQEIIEFPMVLVDARTTTVINEFQRYVRPVHVPVLTPFCKELTGIQQAAVDQSAPFAAVYAEAVQWLGANGLGFDGSFVDKTLDTILAAGGAVPQKQPATAARSKPAPVKTFAVVTCGDWDLKTMLPAQLKLSGLPHSPFFARWANIKTVFGNQLNVRARGMPDMLQHLQLPLEGRHHSGIDDCRNIAAIVIQLLRRGVAVDITANATGLPADNVPRYRRCADPDAPITHTLAPRTLAPFGADGAAPAPAATAGPQTAAKAPAQQPPSAAGPAPPTAVLDADGNLIPRDDQDPLATIAAQHGPGRTMAPAEETSISKRLSAVLRHNAEKLGMRMTRNGFVSVDELLSHRNFKNLDLPTLAAIVARNGKQRFRLVYGADGLVYVCANQGHSIQGIVPDLREVRAAAEVPVCVHGTNDAAWAVIRSDGLRPMGREHIHFAKGLFGEVVSGMRATANILIYMDVAAMLRDEIPLFESRNGVLLSPGTADGAVIAPKYFAKVIDKRTGLQIGGTSTVSASQP